VKVIIVCDNAASLAKETAFLAERCSSVNVVPDALLAKSDTRSDAWDLILIDGRVSPRTLADDIMLLNMSSSGPLFILTEGGSEVRADLLVAGARECLSFPFDHREFEARATPFLKGRAAAAPVATVSSSRFVLQKPGFAELDGKQLHLSPSEYSILEMLLARHGSLVTAKELSMKIRSNHGSTLKVAECLVARLRNKLRQAGLTNVIHNVYGQGYIIRAA
jgi:two-component system cell cycle response regulator CtrA